MDPAQASSSLPLSISAATLGAFSAGMVVIGAAYGISRLASSALDGMARQPEIADKIQLAMIIAAALIEGLAFFCAYVCLQSLSS